MAGRPKPTPLEAFEDNMADARGLVLLAEAATNLRARRMRRELRERVGEAIKAPRKRWDQLDCVESGDLFIVVLPDSRLGRQQLQNQAPLLRQAIVAGCAAAETYLADRVIERSRRIVRGNGDLGRLARIPMSVGDWGAVESYEYRRRGITECVIAPWVRERASTAPNVVGELLALVGVDRPHGQLDAARQMPKGTTEDDLQRVTDRRNRIAHSGDRKGHGRASIRLDEVREHLDCLHSIVAAIEKVLGD